MTDNQSEQVERLILEAALISPKAALMQLTLELDRELRKLLASTGVLKRYLDSDSPTLPNGLKVLSSASGATVPKEVEERITQFWSLRNKAVHQEVEIPVVAFDLGLGL